MVSRRISAKCVLSPLKHGKPFPLVLLVVAVVLASCDQRSERVPKPEPDSPVMTMEERAQSIRHVREALADAREADAVPLLDRLLMVKEALTPEQAADVERLNAMLARQRAAASRH